MWISRAKSEKASREEYEEVGKMRPKCDLTLSCRMEQTSCPGSHAPTAKPSTAPPTYPGTHCVRPPTQVHIACAHLPRYILRAPTYPGTHCVRLPTQVHIACAHLPRYILRAPTYPGTYCVRPPTQVHIACAHLPRYILRAPTYPGTYCVRPPTQVHIASAVEFAGQVAGHGATQTVVRHVPV